jgi:hypothetical protein
MVMQVLRDDPYMLQARTVQVVLADALETDRVLMLALDRVQKRRRYLLSYLRELERDSDLRELDVEGAADWLGELGGLLGVW